MPNLRTGNPEDLHNIAYEGGKKAVDTFVNPGTPNAALVSDADRKTGVISGSATGKLREKLGSMTGENPSPGK